MWLLLRAANKDIEAVIGHEKSQGAVIKINEAERRFFQRDLFRFLSKQNVRPESLENISVDERSGSFSTVRQIVGLANILHWMYGIPQQGVRVGKGTQKKKKIKFLMPQYTAKPNITRPGYPQKQ